MEYPKLLNRFILPIISYQFLKVLDYSQLKDRWLSCQRFQLNECSVDVKTIQNQLKVMLRLKHNLKVATNTKIFEGIKPKNTAYHD